MDVVISQEHGWSADIGNKPESSWEINEPDNSIEFLILIMATIIIADSIILAFNANARYNATLNT